MSGGQAFTTHNVATTSNILNEGLLPENLFDSAGDGSPSLGPLVTESLDTGTTSMTAPQIAQLLMTTTTDVFEDESRTLQGEDGSEVGPSLVEQPAVIAALVSVPVVVAAAALFAVLAMKCCPCAALAAKGYECTVLMLLIYTNMANGCTPSHICILPVFGSKYIVFTTILA